MYISALGEQYEGTFKQNQREGQGKLLTSTGDQYEGEFARHKMNGNGVMTYADGGVYKGEWEASQRCGNGHMVWAGNDEYEGKWEADRAHGDGLFTHPAGYERDGEWEAGQPVTVAQRAVVGAWNPPPTEILLEGAVLALTPIPAPEEGAEPPADVPAEPPLNTLTLSISVQGVEEVEGTCLAASTGLVDALPQSAPAFASTLDGGDMTEGGGGDMENAITCEGAEHTLDLSLPEGVARPITLLIVLSDPAAGGATIASAEVALPLSANGETMGTLTNLPLPKAGAAAETPPYATLTMGYAAKESPAEVVEAELIEPASEETLAGLFPEPCSAGSMLTPISGVLCRLVVVEPPPAAEEEPEPPPPPTKGKGKEPEPEPEPAGPQEELYPVAAESGRAIQVTLQLPTEVAEQRLAEAEAAAAEAQSQYETALAEFEAAQAAAAEAPDEAPAEPAPAPEPPAPLAPPTNEWDLGTVLTKHGRLLVRGLTVPMDVPTGPATLIVAEATPPLALFDLPHIEPISIPVSLLAEGAEAEPPPPPDPKGKKK